MLSIFLLTLLSFLSFAFFRKFPKKRPFYYIGIGLINLLIVEIFSYLFILFLVLRGGNFYLVGNQVVLDKFIKSYLVEKIHASKRNKYSTYRIDETLGYTVDENKYDHQFRITNSYGMRTDKEYSLIPQKNKMRIATFGDSFVYCDGEISQNSWPYMLEKSSKNLEVLNFGVSGYGLGQSYLRYLKDGLLFNPDVIFFNYIVRSPRDTIDIKAILSGTSLLDSYLYRVRFWNNNQTLLHQSVSPFDLFDPLFRDEHVYKPLGLREKDMIWSNPALKMFNIVVIIKQAVLKKVLPPKIVARQNDLKTHLFLLRNLLDTAKQHGSTVLFFFSKDLIDLPNEIKILLSRYPDSIRYVNSSPIISAVFKYNKAERKNLLNHTNHFNPEGNQYYAQAVASVLAQGTWGHGQRKFQFNRKSSSFVKVK